MCVRVRERERKTETETETEMTDRILSMKKENKKPRMQSKMTVEQLLPNKS